MESERVRQLIESFQRLRRNFVEDDHELTIQEVDSQYTASIDKIPDSEEIVLFDLGGEG